jgi:hypothetical protein
LGSLFVQLFHLSATERKTLLVAGPRRREKFLTSKATAIP